MEYNPNLTLGPSLKFTVVNRTLNWIYNTNKDSNLKALILGSTKDLGL